MSIAPSRADHRSPRRLLAGALATAVALGACGGGGGATAPVATTSPSSTPATSDGVRDGATAQPVAVLSPDEAAAVAREVNAFGLDLHTGLLAEQDGGNVVTSPLSASIVLAMLQPGPRPTPASSSSTSWDC